MVRSMAVMAMVMVARMEAVVSVTRVEVTTVAETMVRVLARCTRDPVPCEREMHDSLAGLPAAAAA